MTDEAKQVVRTKFKRRDGTTLPTETYQLRLSVEIIDRLRRAAHLKSRRDAKYTSMADMIRAWIDEKLKEEETVQ